MIVIYENDGFLCFEGFNSKIKGGFFYWGLLLKRYELCVGDVNGTGPKGG
ncbi:hypothetical protein bcgnr5391_55160 [Bacillus cereus]